MSIDIPFVTLLCTSIFIINVKVYNSEKKNPIIICVYFDASKGVPYILCVGEADGPQSVETALDMSVSYEEAKQIAINTINSTFLSEQEKNELKAFIK